MHFQITIPPPKLLMSYKNKNLIRNLKVFYAEKTVKYKRKTLQYIHLAFFFFYTVLTRVKVFSLPLWFPLSGSFESSTICLRWVLVVFTRARVQIVLVVHPAVRSRRKVRSLGLSTVHFILQFTDVIPDLCHQQEQKIKGSWRSLEC